MMCADELWQLRRQTSLAAFERQHPSLWLVRALTELQPTHFATAPFSPQALDKIAQRGGTVRMVDRMQVQPDRYALHALCKGDGNPWQDRIYVGRTPNNDIAVPDESISKVQAYFQLGSDGKWRLYDADSTNGTRVGDALLPAGGVTEVGSGTTIVFGGVVCELASSADLFD